MLQPQQKINKRAQYRKMHIYTAKFGKEWAKEFTVCYLIIPFIFPKITIPLLANIYIKADFSDFLFHSLSKDQKKSVIPCVGVFPHIKNKTLLNWLSKKVSLMQKSIKSAVSIVLTALSLSSLSACSALDSFRKVQDDFFHDTIGMSSGDPQYDAVR